MSTSKRYFVLGKGGMFLGYFMGPAGIKSEGEYLSHIALPNTPAFGSGDGGL